jgi:site-specific recombinase
MHALLERITAQPDDNSIDRLAELIHMLRPPGLDKIDVAVSNVRTLAQLLKGNVSHAVALRQYLVTILSTRHQTSLYTDIGILSNDGFFTELFRRLSYRILPPAIDDTYLRDCLDILLSKKTDYLWIRAVPVDEWLALFDILAHADVSEEEAVLPSNVILQNQANRQKTVRELLEAIQILSYRISDMGLEPSLILIYPDIEAFKSPFLEQNVEMHRYLKSYRHYLEGESVPAEDGKHLLVMLGQCDAVITKIRKSALRQGTSVSLTYLLVRLTQSIDRLRKLLSVVDGCHLPVACALEVDVNVDNPSRRTASFMLCMELVEAHNRKYAVRELFASNITLLARNVTENASRTGEHYIAENRSEYTAMFRSSAGAGMIVGFMALFKILASYLRTAPLVEAFLFSLNYSLGFMLIHILHFTIATKQPAMTASRIASGLHSRDGRNIDLDSLVELIVNVVRTQFVAVLGNLMTAFPMAYLIAWGYFTIVGHHLVTPEKAHHMLHDIDPLGSLALFHAAIAGVCLFVAGLISGYYDNQALYTRMAQRIIQLQWLKRLLGMHRLVRLGHYLEENLGGLMGNFYFGILLGTIGTLGFMLGLPIDIRHITFSAAHFAIALVAFEHQMTWQTVAISIAGVLSVGTVNLLVSFGLALLVALRSRQVRFIHGLRLLKALVIRFWHSPKDFYIPPENMGHHAGFPPARE